VGCPDRRADHPGNYWLHSLAISPWGGLGVLGIWAAAVLFIGALALGLRDAKRPS
jgi:hypothetical protein